MVGVVEGHDLDVFRRILHHALRDRRACRPVPSTHDVGIGDDREHHAVVMAVIRPFDLTDGVPSGCGAGDPDRVHRRLGA